MNKLNTNAFVFFVGGLLGSLFFLSVFGFEILDVTNIDWLIHGGDLAQHYLGWETFRNSSWCFPIGLMDNIVYPLKESIVYTDSIPLFAIFFKLFNAWLPTNFQYFGLFGLLTYFLQGAMGALLVNKLTRNTIYAIIGSLLFLSSSTVLARIFVHTSLSLHAIILCAIYLCVSYTPQRTFKQNLLYWSSLFAVSSMIHLYYLPMLVFFLLFYLLNDFFFFKEQHAPIKKMPFFSTKNSFFLRARNNTIVFVAALLSAVACLLLMGAFYSHSAKLANGFMEYSSNLNTFVNTQENYFLLQPLPLAFSLQYEGFGYLGLGVLLLISAIFFTAFFADNSRSRKEEFFLKPIFIWLTFFVFLLLAVSPRVTFNQYVLFEYPLPAFFTNQLKIFRSTGRFIWCDMYILFAVVLYLVHRNFARNIAVFLLVFAVFLQYFDLTGFIKTKRQNTLNHDSTQVLQSPVWDELTKEYKHVVFLGSMGNWPPSAHLFAFWHYAASHKMTINDAYLARKNDRKIYERKTWIIGDILNDNADAQSIYVFGNKDEAESLIGSHLHLYAVDGAIIGLKEAKNYLIKYELK